MSFIEIAPLDRLPRDRGVAAIVNGEFVAVFRLADDEVLAIDHLDPFTRMPVLARGLVASVGDRVVVVSPLHKQRFDLHTGVCIDDPATSVRVWPTVVADGVVRIDAEPIANTGTVTQAESFVDRVAFEPTIDTIDVGAA